jgi:hypothetical protein
VKIIILSALLLLPVYLIDQSLILVYMALAFLMYVNFGIFNKEGGNKNE